MKNYFFLERVDGLSLRQFERIGNKPLVITLTSRDANTWPPSKRIVYGTWGGPSVSSKYSYL